MTILIHNFSEYKKHGEKIMSIHYKKSLFIFRRDLRIEDNTALIEAARASAIIVPCFIFDPRQVSDSNEYKSENCIQFMVESLLDLDKQLKKHGAHLYIFHGHAEDMVAHLIKEEKIEALFCNRDYTPFSSARDKAMRAICIQSKVAFHQYADALLHEPEEVKTGSGNPYLMFTPFLKQARGTLTVREPQKLPKITFYTKKISLAQPESLYKKIAPVKNKEIAVCGGRSEALTLMKNLEHYKNYEKERNLPALNATTHLSAHNKFGTVSIREVYHAIGKKLGRSHTLIQELYWRDFFTHIAFHFMAVFGHSFKKKYEKLSWKNNKKQFDAWCSGKTGFPIVDAGMRELNATGYMHNRVRMIVASFLVKDLHIDWRWGEKYFAQKLVDYDPAVNNGNWQWVASTGCDAQPYFRIFNPWLQQKKFDVECLYIKKWIPELQSLAPKIIHTWFKNSASLPNYPKPIVDHTQEALVTKKMYKQV